MLSAKKTANFGNVFHLLHPDIGHQERAAVALIVPVKPVTGAKTLPQWDYVVWSLAEKDVALLNQMHGTATTLGPDSLSTDFNIHSPSLEMTRPNLRVNNLGEVFFITAVPAVGGGTVDVVSNFYLKVSGVQEVMATAQGRNECLVGYAPGNGNQIYLFTEQIILKTDSIHRHFYQGLNNYSESIGSDLDMLCTSVIESR